jgi:hypothetical protein
MELMVVLTLIFNTSLNMASAPVAVKSGTGCIGVVDANEIIQPCSLACKEQRQRLIDQ